LGTPEIVFSTNSRRGFFSISPAGFFLAGVVLLSVCLGQVLLGAFASALFFLCFVGGLLLFCCLEVFPLLCTVSCFSSSSCIRESLNNILPFQK
jgi:hypothetical protein